SRQAINASRVKSCELTISLPTVLATVTPNRKGPRNSATAVKPSAVCGRNAREEIMVATILLESRIPLMNSKINASIITKRSSLEINGMLSFLHHNIRNGICRFIAAVCRVRQMAVHFAQFQHLHNMMDILRTAEQVGDRLTVDHLHAVFERLGALGMIERNFGMLRQAQYPLPDLICRIL